jgi:hypothetical protein
MGNPDELKCLQQELQQQSKSSSSNDGLVIVVHNATCNTGRTSDGIEAGGRRLAKEIMESVIIGNVSNETTTCNATTTTTTTTITTSGATTLSIVGNSLGGLYARYALGCLDWTKMNHLQPRIFCTLSTPHLGLQSQRWFASPLMEHVAAIALHQTGQDLLGDSSSDNHHNNNNNNTATTNIIEQLATDPKFAGPLASFDRRIAHANAHGTDLLVPTATAAFLQDTDSPHNCMEQDTKPFTRVVFETPKVDPVTAMPLSISERLDAMGWTKVFWDLSQKDDSSSSNNNERVIVDDSTIVNTTTTAKALLEQFCTPTINFRQPFGHTLFVANSKNSIYERLHQQGRPIMQYLARSILDELANGNRSVDGGATATRK